MKAFKRTTALFLACVMFFTLALTGCGQKEADITTTGINDSGSTEGVAATEDKPEEENKSEVKTSDIKKKIVIIQETNDEPRDTNQKNILSALDKNGYNNQTSAITEIKMAGDEKKSQEVIDQIKGINPDVVILNGVQFFFKTVAKPLEGSGIPIVLCTGIENKQMNFIDESDKPRQNITGLYTMSKDMQVNSFKLLQNICPISGKKAVFITLEGKFAKKDVENNLKMLNIELKDFVEVKYQEEFTDAVNKYNIDDEVGWILVGYWPAARKDGKPSNNVEFGKTDVVNRKKPSVTYFEAAVKVGILCGLGVDLAEQATQATEMAVKILNGEKVENVKAEVPRKINIVLNQKNAEQLGISIPAEILGSASKVYTDYDGNYKK